MLHARSPELATILSVIAPGSGHFYLGTDKVPLAAGLLVATVAAVVLSYFSFLLFLIGFVIWLGAVALALSDLRGGVKGLEATTLAPNVVGVLLIAAGALLVVALLLPWYHLAFSTVGVDFSANASGYEALSVIDIVLTVIGVAAIVAGAASLGLGPVTPGELPRELRLAVAVGGAVAVVLILFRMFVDSSPGGADATAGVEFDIGRAPGILLALDAALVLLIANAATLRAAANRQSTRSARRP